ncbi:hypothetical protein [Sphingomonas sp.]|uniref:hypothetical protein n=1 Tax=Sphingomonas sp. TaxID=28214 RepID=UPI001B02536C|nr:hypothetical protein [Sphingomonas sp.]MBO9713278.1 hypothetical protein [Sphingomonas sp.]
MTLMRSSCAILLAWLAAASPALADCVPTTRAPICADDTGARQITVRMLMPRADRMCVLLESKAPSGPWVQTNLSSQYPLLTTTSYAAEKGPYNYRFSLFLVDRTNSCDRSKPVPGGGAASVVKK